MQKRKIYKSFFANEIDKNNSIVIFCLGSKSANLISIIPNQIFKHDPAN